jgi:hypothetical protein
VDERSQLVEFRSDGTRDAIVGLSFERDASGIGLDLFKVRVDAQGISCDHGALSHEGDGLAGFISELARDWRGWDGTRRWDALEHGMSIEATHHGRRIELLFIVRRDYERDAWELRVPILLEPGESLTSAASACAALLGRPRAS